MPTSPLHAPVLRWFAEHARDLPWRRAGTTPWGVLVSEVMLQQTPVARVAPVWEEWLTRWPDPRALAAASRGEAVRAWGRLGYPRRALRLHETATVLTERHEGQVPSDLAALRALPGVGEYTAAAVASFGFGQAHPVLDTNVRRVLARVLAGQEQAPRAVTVAERRTGLSLVPDDPATAARWAVAVMELGALVCTARSPRCGGCPIGGSCAWRRAGHPVHGGPARPRQGYAGTDRQARGALLAALRAADGPLGATALADAWPADALQRVRALDGLLADGLVERRTGQRFVLPGG